MEDIFKKEMNKEENSDKRSSDSYIMFYQPWLTIELDFLDMIEYLRIESYTDIQSEHIIICIGTIYISKFK